MVKYRAVSFKKDQIAALYFTKSDIVHGEDEKVLVSLSIFKAEQILYRKFIIMTVWS